MIEMLEYGFIRTALGGTLAIGAVCAFLGVYVVLRRIVFVGATLAQISSAGIALGILTGWSPNLLSLAFTFVAVLLLAHPRFGARLPRDASLGIAFTVSGAVAVLFVAHTAAGNEEVVHLVQGNLLAMTPAEARRLAIVFGTILLIHVALFKEFMYVSFDPQMAVTQGYGANRWDLSFYLLLGLAIALAIKAIGILLMFAFLVVPASVGLMVARGIKGTFGVAVTVSALAVFVGVYFSYRFDYPSAPMIVAVLGGLLLMAVGWRAVAR